MVPGEEGQDLGLGLEGVVAQKLRGPPLGVELLQDLGALLEDLPLKGHGGPGAALLLLHGLLKALRVHAIAPFRGDLHGEVQGEAVGVVEPEGLLPGKDLPGLEAGEEGVQALEAPSRVSRKRSSSRRICFSTAGRFSRISG